MITRPNLGTASKHQLICESCEVEPAGSMGLALGRVDWHFANDGRQ